MLQEHMKQSLDLTNLNTDVSQTDILALCKRAVDNPQYVAAVCSWSAMAETIRNCLNTSDYFIGTVSVINFPEGTSPHKNLDEAVSDALQAGAQEIDLVINWNRYNSHQDGIYPLVSHIRNNPTKDFILKVILETGKMKPYLIYQASIDAMEAGADYLKTSTGTTPIGATLNSTKYICEAVKHYYLETGKRVGIKYSGGIKTSLDAQKFVWQLHQYDLGVWLKHGLIRFGVGTSSKVLEEWSKVPD